MDTFLRRIEKSDNDRCRDCTPATRMYVYYVLYSFHGWCSLRWKIMAACRKEMRSSLVRVKQGFRSRKPTAGVLEFIGTTTAGRWPE